MRTLLEGIHRGMGQVDPGKLALVGAEASLAYGELRDGAGGIATALRRAGIGRGSRVGVWMEKSPACVQALLGVLEAGAAYVPLDPRSPPARCRSVAVDCGLDAWVVDGLRLAALPALLEAGPPRLVLVEPGTRLELPPGLPADRVLPLAAARALPASQGAAPEPDDLAYVLYTSGSTGTPKGVAHTHASGAAFVDWVNETFGTRADDVFSSHAPFHFDLSISDLFAALSSGATIRLLSGTEAMLAPYLARMLDPWGITVWYSVPSILVSMLESGELERRPPRRLRILFFAGEVFATPQLRRLRRALPWVRLVNLFGPTETNVCTYHELPADLPDGDDAPIPIGKGCEHLDCFVVDDDGREVREPGREGTLWVRGGNVMLGYWGDPARTRAMLLPDPRCNERLACCTGDRVRLRADGSYEFRGRRDHMIKTRGYRVELGEIEAVLAAHPGVREAVAVPLPDPSVGNRLVATVAPRSGASLDPAELRAFVAERLPGYMVPERIEVLAELPRTSTGKADRNELRARWQAPAAQGA